jgi:hypothetical protein
MEKIESFVARTRGPMIPFVAEWYPWAYAHHYLRIEMERVPMDLDRPARSLSLDNAMGLVHRWCAITGEEAEQAARRLADAYLERWGLQPPEAAERRRTRLASRDERWHSRSTGSDPEPVRVLSHPQTLTGEPTLILPVIPDEIQDADPSEQPARIQLTTGH